MIVMPANNTGVRVGYLAGRYPGRIGHLYSPGKAYRADSATTSHEFLPYALDNGAFPAFTRRQAWDPAPWRDLLAWAANNGQAPRWALVPDVVGDRLATLRSWDKYAAEVAAFGWPLGFAAQDGMSFDDVPREAAVVFLGGSDEWKPAAIAPWCARFPRVHVGRVNAYRLLRIAEDAGAESVDGTGWARTNRQWKGLEAWLREVSGECAREVQASLSFGERGTATAPGTRCGNAAEPAPCGDGHGSRPQGDA